jgi:hypothetical protein
MQTLQAIWQRRRFLADYRRTARRSTIILSAGMPRSGSTWLFNAARLLLRAAGVPELSSGWIGDWSSLPKAERLLLKVHDYDGHLARHAPIILYSYRDIRDALASSQRKFGTEPTLALARRWLRSDERWRAKAGVVLRYESMLEDSLQSLCNLAEALAVPHVDLDEVCAQLRHLERQSATDDPDSYNRETLLHPGHVTDGRHGTWAQWLSPELVGQLEREFADWFRANGYPCGQPVGDYCNSFCSGVTHR